MEILIDGVRYVPAETQPAEVQFYCVGFGGATPDDLVREMVSRFLGWKLPKDFAPDAGISFTPTQPDGYDEPGWWPIGTNLLHAGQAEEMVRHMLGVPNAPAQAPAKAAHDAGN